MTAALISGPALEPVSLADVKAHLRIETDEDDPLIAAAITSARVHVEAVTRRSLIKQNWRIYLADWPKGRAIELPVSPVISVSVITFYDIVGAPTLFAPENWRLEAAANPPRIVARLRPAAALYDNGIEIDVTAGYGVSSIDVPAPLRQAILILVTHWYEHRGMVGHDFAPAIAPAGFDALIAPYKVRAL